MMAVMVSLHKRLETGTVKERERRFFTHSLRHLKILSGCSVEAEEWTITSYEVEFGREIGSGGLYVSCVFVTIMQPLIVYFSSGRVFQGSWNRTKVALKVLVANDGATPSSLVGHE